MNVKKMMRVFTLGAALAVTSCNFGAATMEVKAAEIAEETGAYAGLDEILRQAYAAFSSQDYLSICALDLNDATRAFAEQVRASGADRYVCDIDGNTKAMLYTPADGGYWWYFGQLENGLRQGSGTTFICGSETSYQMFRGAYAADVPVGAGKMTRHGNGYDVTFAGGFQGAYLNGTYQVDYVRTDSGLTSSIAIPYVNNRIQTGSDDNWYYAQWWADERGVAFGNEQYGWGEWELVYNEAEADGVYSYAISAGYDVLAFGMFGINEAEGTKSASWINQSFEERDGGLSVLKGNADGVALVSSAAGQPIPTPAQPAPEEITPVLPEAEVPVTPEQPTITPTSYTVERGDNLCKIAEKIYGDRDLYTLIYEANKDVIKKNYVIFANQVLVIPVR